MSATNPIFFAGWWPLFRIVVVGSLAYVALLVTLRAGGARTIAKTNLFDFIVSVAIGSVFGRIITAKEVVLAEACTAFALLTFLQYGISRLRLRSVRFKQFVDGKPQLLYFNGAYLSAAMERNRFRTEDIEEAVRTKGYASFDEVAAVVLEPGGELSVLHKQTGPAVLAPEAA